MKIALFENVLSAHRAHNAYMLRGFAWILICLLVCLFTDLFLGDDNSRDEVDGECEEPSPSCGDYFMHFLTLFWKILFAFIPPTGSFQSTDNHLNSSSLDSNDIHWNFVFVLNFFFISVFALNFRNMSCGFFLLQVSFPIARISLCYFQFSRYLWWLCLLRCVNIRHWCCDRCYWWCCITFWLYVGHQRFSNSYRICCIGYQCSRYVYIYLSIFYASVQKINSIEIKATSWCWKLKSNGS